MDRQTLDDYILALAGGYGKVLTIVGLLFEFRPCTVA
jgi:hypothetical protein